MIDLNEHVLGVKNEINVLFNYKKNLKKFLFSQTACGKMRMMDFERIINELERITLEIIHLEKTKTQLTKLNDKL
jgi:hypothetical protein